MTKLTKAQITEVAAHDNAIAEARHEVEVAVETFEAQRLVALETFNKTVEQAWGDVSDALGNLNIVLEAARSFRDDLVSSMDDYASDRSEKWQDGDGGAAYDSWKNEWESADLDYVFADAPDPVDVQDLMDVSFDIPTDSLMDLPVAPEK